MKAIGLPTEERHVKQAIDYAANQGVDWVILTNAVSWTLYKVTFAKPIGQEEVIAFRFLDIDPKDGDQLDALFALSKAGWAKDLPADINAHKQSLSRFMLGAFLLSEPILDTLRREIRKLCDVQATNEQISTILENEVIKREVLEGEKADGCAKKVSRYLAKAKRAKNTTDASSPTSEGVPAIQSTTTADPVSVPTTVAAQAISPS